MTVSIAAILASGSPRRASILRDAGVVAQVILPALDDADAPTDMRDPCAHVMSLAWFKARLVLGQIAQVQTQLPRWLIAADTMCVQDGRIIGKAASGDEARSMLRCFQGRTHEVVTGVCIVDRSSGARRLFFDSASRSIVDIGIPSAFENASKSARSSFVCPFSTREIVVWLVPSFSAISVSLMFRSFR